MNTISSFVYWASVFEKLGYFLSLGAVVVFIISLVAFASAADDGDFQKGARRAYTGLGLVIAMWVMALFVPGKDTLYAMAAAEMAGQIAQTPEAAKAREIFNKALDALDAKLEEAESSK